MKNENAKKSILFITPQLPYPPVSGGTIKSFKLIAFLGENYNLHMITLLKGEDHKNEKDFLECAGKYLNSYKSFKISDNISKRNVKNLLMSYVHGVPFAVIRNRNRDLIKYIKDLIDTTQIDYIMVDHYISFQFIEPHIEILREKKIKILLHEHNAEYILWDRYSKNEKNILKKIIAKIESIRVKNYERKICLLSDKVLCVSSNDIDNLKKIGIPNEKLALVMSVGDDKLLELENPSFENTEEALLFIGTLTWEANIDGLIWFIKNGWNHLKQKHPDLKFYIVGKNPPNKLINFVKNYDDIILTGYVENLDIYYQKCRVFVSPLRFGSGIKIKNVNAMYRGIPLVTTSIGAEGIDGINGEHFFIEDSINGMIDKISLLLQDKFLWEKLSYNARKLMKERYTWERALENLRKVLED